jgi:PRTRC genetic system protein B
MNPAGGSMRTYVEIGGSEELRLKGALLVYQGKSRGFVTWHELRQTDAPGAPFLGEAQELSTEFVRNLAQGLGTGTPTEIFPQTVLVRTAELIVWWTPASIRTMFFTSNDAQAQGLNGRRFPQPPLVCKVSGRDFWVRALFENRRPHDAKMKLMIAPYWNVDGETGWTCQGSMRSPGESGIASIGLWEQAFFQSEFTHQNGVRKLTTHPDGFLGLWSSLAGTRTQFPVAYLNPANETLQEFVMRR